MSSQSNVPVSVPTPSGFLDRGPGLPKEYGITRLVLVPRDPQWMHAYWEVAPYTWEEAERNFGAGVRTQGRAVLRFSYSQNGSKKSFDVGIQLDARNWYIFSPSRGGQWHAELGLVLPDGRFVLLAISNEITLPNGAVSEVQDEKWAVMKAEWERLFELSGGGKLGVGSLDVARMLAQRWEMLRAVSSWFGAPAAPSSWQGFPGSSWSKPPQGGRKGFWLEAEAELIVYGATEPDAKVTVQGKDIQLNPDGTFSFRYAFPNGKLDVPIHATNKDGDLRKSVEFFFNRDTKKSD
jgi:uncharacterized protein